MNIRQSLGDAEVRLQPAQELERLLRLLGFVPLVVRPDHADRVAGSTATALTVVEPTSMPTNSCGIAIPLA